LRSSAPQLLSRSAPLFLGPSAPQPRQLLGCSLSCSPEPLELREIWIADLPGLSERWTLIRDLHTLGVSVSAPEHQALKLRSISSSASAPQHQLRSLSSQPQLSASTPQSPASTPQPRSLNPSVPRPQPLSSSASTPELLSNSSAAPQPLR